MLLSDIKIVLSEIQRVLLPGGRLIAVSMSNDENVAKVALWVVIVAAIRIAIVLLIVLQLHC